jgi:hypothetical protein
MAQIQTNPWSFTEADQAVSTAIVSITALGASALVTATAHGLANNAKISIQGANPAGWNGGYVVQAVPSANTFLINVPDGKRTLASAGAAGNVLTAAYLDMVRAEQMLWDVALAGTLLLTNIVGNLVWNPIAAAGQGPYTYGKTFYIEGLVINTFAIAGTLQITIV